MNPLEITSTLTVADWRAYQAACTLRVQSRLRAPLLTRLGIIAVLAALTFVLVRVAAQLGQPTPLPAVLIGAGVVLLSLVLNARRVSNAVRPDEHGTILGPGKIIFDADGIHTEKSYSTSHLDWSVFQEVTQAPGHLFVWIDRVAALIVPLRDLPPDVTPQQAADHILALARNAMTARAPQQPPELADATPALRNETQRRHAGALKSIGQFLLLRTVRHPVVACSDRSLVGLALLSIGIWLLFDWWLAEPGSSFYVYGLLAVGWYASIVLLISYIWSHLSEPHTDFRSTLTMAVAFVPIAAILAIMVMLYVPESASLGALIVIACYATAYGHTGLKSLTSSPQPRAILAGLLALSLAAWFAQSQYVTPQFWYPDEEESADLPEDEHSDATQWRQAEALLFQQAERIDAAVAALERPAELPAAAFFVGFAGMGEQRVFAGEIALANRVIAERYGTAQRSIQLVNDRRDLNALPFASLSALRRTLSDVAHRMDLEQDVLFLSLSSHGSSDGELSVSNGSMPVNNLDVGELADALHASGIQWRVIIVSACYSGMFVEPLRDDHTIVITASAADRTSFGCSDDRDLTYFGEVFYRDALPTAPDLRTAFQRTKAAIAEREKKEGIEPSNPQAYFGTAVERHLRELQAGS